STATNQSIEAAAKQISKPTSSPTKKAILRFTRHRLAMFGLIVIVVLVIASLFGNETTANLQNLRERDQAPSLQHYFGTDRTGRDVFQRTLVGGRVSLSVGLVAVFFSTTIGTTLGAIAGFRQGWVDTLIMRIVDMVMSFPVIV